MMEPPSFQHIIAATATKRLELAGGSTLGQALPEDYVLANFLLRALEERNGQELEFALKSYLRIHVVPLPDEDRCFLVEPLGFISAQLKAIPESNFEKNFEKVKSSKKLDELIELIDESRDSINALLNVDDSVFLGVMSSIQASEFMSLLECPTKSEIESYAVTFPEVLESQDLEHTITELQSSILIMKELDIHLAKFVHILSEQISHKISEEETTIEKNVAQLDRRIESLEKLISELEEEADTDEKLEVRKQALERDQIRRKALLSEFDDKSRSVLEGKEGIQKGVVQLQQMLRDQQNLMNEILVPIGSTNISTPWTILLTPFIVIGYSKKGQLRVSVYPPSRFNEVETRVGIRRDFIDVLDEASEFLSTIASQLSKRANSDVNMRKYLRESSELYNLLALKESRTLLREGVKALQADGFVKESHISELESILSGFSEKSISSRESIKIKPVSTQLKGQCHAIFHVYDELNKPIENAELDLGGMIVRTDIRGSVEVDLARSSYEAVVSASGFKNKTIEFRLDSSDDVVIPIVLSPLPPEERLAQELDRLLERAKRLDVIRDRLWKAFQKQGETLLSIPAYRGILVELLTELGYEPESWITEAQSEGGMVKRLLKRDDREEALRRDILRIAEDSKESGGLLLFSELLLLLDKMGWATSFDEVETTLKEMTREGLMEGISSLENGTRLIKFIPVALTDDPQKILNIAASKTGQLTIEDAVLSLGWTEERVMNALNLLVEKGVAKLQRTYSKSTIYWFPGLQEKSE